jgi:sugar phosphate isomerase/epimerase
METSSGPDSPTSWTSQELQERLGISTHAFKTRPIGAREIAAIREAGITRVEINGLSGSNTPPPAFDFHNPSQASEILAECQKQGVSIVSVHGAGGQSPGHGPGCPIYDSLDEGERKAAVKKAVLYAKVAEDLGASVLVGHFFGVAEQCEKTVNEILEQLHHSSVKLTVENSLGDIRDYMAIVDKIGSERFGIVVDTGHARDSDGINPFTKKERARETMVQCGERLFHLHLNDFTNGDHIAPFAGHVHWGEVFAALKDIGYEGTFMFEPGPFRKKYINGDVPPEELLRKVAAFPKTFVERYGTG